MVNVERGSPREPNVVRMVTALDAYVAELYPPESNHLLDIEALCAPDVHFFVARIEGQAVGCGALRLDPSGYGELKRMFVVPEARGKNVGRAILLRLEQEAGEAKLSCVRLETGTRQLEAIGLYRSAGYREIPPFGDYRPDPLSVFMEKRLGIHVTTPRMRLVAGTRALAEAEISDAAHLAVLLGAEVPTSWPPESLKDVLPLFLKNCTQSGACGPWNLGWYGLLETDERSVLCGSVGFKGAPTSAGMVYRSGGPDCRLS